MINFKKKSKALVNVHVQTFNPKEIMDIFKPRHKVSLYKEF